MIILIAAAAPAVLCGVLLLMTFASNIEKNERNKTNEREFSLVCWLLTILALGFVVAAVIGYPYMNIWQKSMSGRAQLAEAESNREIKVREALAVKDSAKLLADAEVTRARGVAEANAIVQNGLGGPEGYLRYLFIESLKDAKATGATVIYVPTEAGLPILEASRLK